MTRIGITGSNGFIGTHLLNTVKALSDKFTVVHFEREWFDKGAALDDFVQSCDVIVHLAGLNRHNDSQFIYDKNTALSRHLVHALSRTGAKPHVIISSSTQESTDNIYGQSKKEGRQIIATWSQEAGAIFTGMIIPNVFGPFGNPFYNSVVATFCHQLANNEKPVIDRDAQLKLIYVGDLISEILTVIESKKNDDHYVVSPRHEISVSSLLSTLVHFKEEYQQRGIIPVLQSTFELQLFNTFRCYMDIENHFPCSYTSHHDQRGAFTELMRAGVSGQTSFSTTVPGVTRGNHFHSRKIERFSVVKGKALIELRRVGTDKVLSFKLDGDTPSYVDMPIWYTHNIKNIGDDLLYTVFWINEPYDPEDPDTYFLQV